MPMALFIPNPTDKELAEIAIATAHTTRAIAGFEPRLPCLASRPKGVQSHEMVDKVVSATKIARAMAPDLMI